MDHYSQSYPLMANQTDRSFLGVLTLSGILANHVQRPTTDMKAEFRSLRTDIGNIRATRNMLWGEITILCAFVVYVLLG